MKVYRIRHIPTGLYWQKARVGSNTLSKKGKVYLNKGTAINVLHGYVCEIHLSRRSTYYDKLLEMAEDGPYIFTIKSQRKPTCFNRGMNLDNNFIRIFGGLK